MKNKFNKILIACIVVIVSVASCKKMDDNYREFIAGGETIYIGKADSIVVRGGANKAEVTWLLLSDPKVSSYKIFWNNRQDSIGNTVVKTDNVDTVRVMIDSITEGTHYFEILTYDKYGNSSVSAQANGKVYGPMYQSTLLNRTYINMERDKRNLQINWMPAETTLAGVELEYVNIDGEMESHFIPPEIETYVLPDFPTNGSFKYRTLFLPDTLALNTFETPYTVTDVDDYKLTGRKISFNAEVRYGVQEDLITIYISNDFDGIYEEENVEAATWHDVTDSFALPTESHDTFNWGPLDISDYTAYGDPVYLSITYTYDPDKGAGRTWIFTNLEVTNADDVVLMGFNDVQFNQVFFGPAPYEDGRSYVKDGSMHFRPYNQTTDLPYAVWGITKALD